MNLLHFSHCGGVCVTTLKMCECIRDMYYDPRFVATNEVFGVELNDGNQWFLMNNNNNNMRSSSKHTPLSRETLSERECVYQATAAAWDVAQFNSFSNCAVWSSLISWNVRALSCRLSAPSSAVRRIICCVCCVWNCIFSLLSLPTVTSDSTTMPCACSSTRQKIILYAHSFSCCNMCVMW